MPGRVLRIMAIGAHPDDCESKAGGCAAMWAAQGHAVRFVYATNGQTGHHVMAGAQLAQRRIAEVRAAANVLGIESQVLPIPNGQIEPSLVYRWMFIRTIREFCPDLILTHRPNDYHPDHRNTSLLVQDSSYLITVPNTCPETPAMKDAPAILYFCDKFQKPYPFQGDIVIATDSVIEKKLQAFGCNESQVFEWMPWRAGVLDQVPADPAGRRQWVWDHHAPRFAAVANRFRAKLLERYGPRKGQAVKYAEAFEICEYGAPVDASAVERLFAGL